VSDDYNRPFERQRPHPRRVSPLLAAMLAVGAVGYPLPALRTLEQMPAPRLAAHDLERIAAAEAKRARKAAKKKGQS
jgi:hypothetical protein